MMLVACLCDKSALNLHPNWIIFTLLAALFYLHTHCFLYELLMILSLKPKGNQEFSSEIFVKYVDMKHLHYPLRGDVFTIFFFHIFYPSQILNTCLFFFHYVLYIKANSRHFINITNLFMWKGWLNLFLLLYATILSVLVMPLQIHLNLCAFYPLSLYHTCQ